ncbi:hypothetical protein [Pedobacter alpinus]|uniref:Uncharacterized protein n=1 Tax=Pedobacter alpinus TaxID=1590643 RepID=A0ABW5TUM6_9SPHI
MKKYNQQILPALLFILLVVCLLAYPFLDDALINKLLACGAMVSGLLLAKYLSNQNIKEKDGQF